MTESEPDDGFDVEEFAKGDPEEQERRQKSLREKVRKALLRGSHTSDSLLDRFKLEPEDLDALFADFLEAGANLVERGGEWSIERYMAPQMDVAWKVVGEPDKPYRFGFIADTHLGSKHYRADVCEELYDWFSDEGVTNVYHCGNWIDGEARFNKHELVPEAHGMQAQLDYFVEHYPERKGVTTYYVAGDDHEGWYSQREGVDIGNMLQSTARQAGRRDLVYLGYKEAFITLEHPETGRHARMLIDHPGGGSSYATSYAAQKRVEAAQSGEKPAVWAFGHWHKAGYFQPRGVHVLLVPCTKDLDTFGRKKGLEYHVGGIIADLYQDPGGAITQLVPWFRNWFDRGYHNQQYSMSGPLGPRD